MSVTTRTFLGSFLATLSSYAIITDQVSVISILTGFAGTAVLIPVLRENWMAVRRSATRRPTPARRKSR